MLHHTLLLCKETLVEQIVYLKRLVTTASGLLYLGVSAPSLHRVYQLTDIPHENECIIHVHVVYTSRLHRQKERSDKKRGTQSSNPDE